MTAHELYQQYGIPHVELGQNVTQEQYARTVMFQKVTLHPPVSSGYMYSSNGQKLSTENQTRQQSVNSTATILSF